MTFLGLEEAGGDETGRLRSGDAAGGGARLSAVERSGGVASGCVSLGVRAVFLVSAVAGLAGSTRGPSAVEARRAGCSAVEAFGAG